MKKILTLLFALCAVHANAAFLGGIPTTNSMHATTNYLPMVAGSHSGQLEWLIPPSNLVAVQNTVILPRTNLAATVFSAGTRYVPTYLASAAVFNLDGAVANLWTVTNAAASHMTINVSNVIAGQWGQIKIPGSGTATNNNATLAFPTGVTVDWLARATNSAAVSNGFLVISWTVNQTLPTTNATAAFRTESQ